MTADVQASALSEIAGFCRELTADPELAARFTADPQLVLLEKKIDISLPLGPEPTSLGSLLARLDPEVRVATVRSISTLLPRSEGDQPTVPLVGVLVFAIANANAGTNANIGTQANAVQAADAYVNANVNANQYATANANTSGTSGRAHFEDGTPEASARRLTIFSGYAECAVAVRLAQLRLTEARQLALLKRAANDGEVVMVSQEDDGATRRMTQYVFHGNTLEIESRNGQNGLEILDARIRTDA